MTSKEKAQNKIKNNCYINPNNCWIWQKYRDKDGYGIVRFEGKLYRVARLALWAFKDVELNKLYALHKCDNRSCCNPDHLYDGDQGQNMYDRMQIGRYCGILKGGRLLKI